VEHFVERRSCPGCDVEAYAVLRRAPFTASEVWDFLERYYAGRVKPADLAGAVFEVRRCEACGLLWQAWHLDAEGSRRLYEEWICARGSLAKKTDADVALYDIRPRSVDRAPRRTPLAGSACSTSWAGAPGAAWRWPTAATSRASVSPRRCAYARQRGVRVMVVRRPRTDD
jgi:hypothetical protein